VPRDVPEHVSDAGLEVDAAAVAVVEARRVIASCVGALRRAVRDLEEVELAGVRVGGGAAEGPAVVQRERHFEPARRRLEEQVVEAGEDCVIVLADDVRLDLGKNDPYDTEPRGAYCVEGSVALLR
jgi:hypothetical protein